MQKNLLEIGKVVNIHGLRGDVKIQPWCDSAGFLCEFDTLYRADGTPMSVASARAHKGMAVVRFAGIVHHRLLPKLPQAEEIAIQTCLVM